MPISALLARIRKLIPAQDDHYEEIVRGFGNGALRPPPSPMSDRELARAIAEFPEGSAVCGKRQQPRPQAGPVVADLAALRERIPSFGIFI